MLRAVVTTYDAAKADEGDDMVAEMAFLAAMELAALDGGKKP